MDKALAAVCILIPLLVFGAEKEKQPFRWRANKVVQNYTEDDVRAEIRFGRNLAARILGKYPLLRNEKASMYVRTIGAGLAAQIGRPDLKFYFAVLDTPEINAFAVPGGYIFLTKGLLAAMDNEAQLAAAIAHEISHVNQRHVVRRLNIRGRDNSFLAGIGAVVGGGVTSGVLLLDRLINKGLDILFEIGIEETQELEADSEAIESVVNLGYDGLAYLKLLRKLEILLATGKGETLSKTHPATSKRTESLKKFLIENGYEFAASKTNAKRFREHVRF